MKSMTGYACVEKTVKNNAVSVEIKGYNNRFLETIVYLPPTMNAVESRVRKAIAEKCGRGKIEVYIRLKGRSGVRLPSVNRDAVKAYMTLFETLVEMTGSDEKAAVRDLITAEGILEENTEVFTDAKAWEIIREPLQSALMLFDMERKREGKNTQKNILAFLADLEQSERRIKEIAPKEETQLKTMVQKKFAEITGGLAIGDNRLLGEAALLVMKYTISEELARLESHFAEFWADTKSTESLGKKLDFYCQEMGREVNTIGAKSQSVEIVREVVSMKESLENIREQLRNVE
ncbi:MAG: YicC family protein [Spirochaetaceae bacterium]|jgi:uncharacterized protein (TIGR00255 family)|nr:YicC family protein [Spirochaetaceae bacterium]